MLDLVGPKEDGKVTLADLKNCKMTNIFFDTFFNLDKFLEHEQRDPFANVRVRLCLIVCHSHFHQKPQWQPFAFEEHSLVKHLAPFVNVHFIHLKLC